jgi:hypothetical protein
MDQNNETTKLKLTLGALRLEYEGREELLRKEIPALVQTMDGLHTSRLVVPFNTLQIAIKDSLTAQDAVAGEIDGIKKNLDSMNDLGETESLRLQMAMDRLSKMISTLSNILKKISDTAESITQNLK